MRDDNRLHDRIKIGMVILLLALAYLLPGLGLRITKDRLRTRQDTKGSGTEAARTEETQETASRGIILVDPGHGGRDPGMIGVDGLEEKGINLEIAQKLQRLLEEEGYEAVLTRQTDAGLYEEDAANKKAQDLKRRCQIIEELEPLVTVSIHQNSYQDPSVQGPQVFYYRDSREGKKLAEAIQEQMNEALQIASPRQIKANDEYYILKHSSGTAVLVECSFLSSPEEAAKIQTEEYQQAVARAICGGILLYLEEKNPVQDNA